MADSNNARTVKSERGEMQKRCRFCKRVIEAGERYCGPGCRLQAIGRQDAVTKNDAAKGWPMITKGLRRPWHKD
jgi:hypothetical protein